MVYTDHLAEGKRIEQSSNATGRDYLRSMGIALVAGREFTTADRERSARMVINEANPVQRATRFSPDDKAERIGVACEPGGPRIDPITALRYE